MKISLLIGLLTISLSAQAKNVACKSLNDCVKKVSSLTDTSYSYHSELKGDISMTSNFQLDKTNADQFISSALFVNGYTRVPLKGKNGYRIIQARDVRYTPTPMYVAGQDQLPNNNDYIMVTINLKNTNSTEVTRSFRPFMSRYGRIIEIKQKNQIIVQDTALNARRLLKLVKSIDTPLSSEQKEKLEEEKEYQRELEQIRAEKCSDIHQELKSLQGQINQLLYKQKS